MKKKGEQLSLGADKENAERGTRNAEQAQAPSIVEYEVEGAAWRCNQFALLAAEVGELTPATLHLFHAQAALRDRGWLIVRRLFGLQPMIPSSGYATEDLRVWSREELREALGITAKQLQAELDADARWSARRGPGHPHHAYRGVRAWQISGTNAASQN